MIAGIALKCVEAFIIAKSQLKNIKDCTDFYGTLGFQICVQYLQRKVRLSSKKSCRTSLRTENRNIGNIPRDQRCFSMI